MARKVPRIQESLSDDDAPEVVSRSTSKADAKRSQKVLHDFEAEEKARKKVRNRERDQKLKERARATRGGKTASKVKGVRFADEVLELGGGVDGGGDADDVEARMLKAMREAANEVESDQGEEMGGDDGDGLMGSGSDSSFARDDAEMLSGESDPIDPEAPTGDEEMVDDEDDETVPLQADVHGSSRKANYLADDLFAAAFASQNSKPPPKKEAGPVRQHTVKKQRRKSTAHPKDLVIGGRTIRTLPRSSDLQSQVIARTIPSAGARKFMDQSLALEGEQALLKAKRRGWERRPANVGVMKYQGAPHGFAQSTRQRNQLTSSAYRLD